MKQSYWPPPVYVAQFSDGRTSRMSFWSERDKPLDFQRGRRLSITAHRNEFGAGYIVAAHVELDGQTFVDTGQVAPAKAPRKPSCKLVLRQALAACERGDYAYAHEVLKAAA